MRNQVGRVILCGLWAGCGRYCCRGLGANTVFVVSTVVALAAKPLFVPGVTQAKIMERRELSVGVVGFLDFTLRSPFHSFTPSLLHFTSSNPDNTLLHETSLGGLSPWHKIPITTGNAPVRKTSPHNRLQVCHCGQSRRFVLLPHCVVPPVPLTLLSQELSEDS